VDAFTCVIAFLTGWGSSRHQDHQGQAWWRAAAGSIQHGRPLYLLSGHSIHRTPDAHKDNHVIGFIECASFPSANLLMTPICLIRPRDRCPANWTPPPRPPGREDEHLLEPVLEPRPTEGGCRAPRRHCGTPTRGAAGSPGLAHCHRELLDLEARRTARDNPRLPVGLYGLGRVWVTTTAVQIRTFCAHARCRAGPASPVRSSLAVDVVHCRAAARVHRSRLGIGSASAARQGAALKGSAKY
jgi:hypothetical protein